jgi:hypothetical protein
MGGSDGGGSGIDGGGGNDTITVSAVVTSSNSNAMYDSSSSAYAMYDSSSSGSNSIDGGGGNDHITIIGHVDTSSNSNNVIKGGTGGVEEGVVERDILHIDQNNMEDIISLSNVGKSAGKETISGFETLLLDMTDNGELDLSAVLQNLTHINSSGGTPNELIIGVNQQAAMQNGAWVISGGDDDTAKVTGVEASGLVEDENAANVMDGYTAYTNADGDLHVYIQQEIKLITGDN